MKYSEVSNYSFLKLYTFLKTEIDYLEEDLNTIMEINKSNTPNIFKVIFNSVKNHNKVVSYKSYYAQNKISQSVKDDINKYNSNVIFLNLVKEIDISIELDNVEYKIKKSLNELKFVYNYITEDLLANQVKLSSKNYYSRYIISELIRLGYLEQYNSEELFTLAKSKIGDCEWII